MISSTSPTCVVYKYNGTSWGSPQTFTTSSGTSGKVYSVALSSDGTKAIVGDYFSSATAGYAAVFTYSGGSWGNEQQLIATTSPYDNFGRSVALSSDGNTALVSAPGTNGGEGYVAVYRYSGGSWSSAVQLTVTGPLYAGFGQTLALSGDGNTAFISIDGGSGGGAPYVGVYRYSGGVWSFAQALPITIVDPSGSLYNFPFQLHMTVIQLL
jgi:hypothetical protein